LTLDYEGKECDILLALKTPNYNDEK
jgi:hypothetical protein